MTEVVAWAAGNGDRSENADYHYGKKRLREIDRRIRFLRRRIDAAEIVDPAAPRTGRAATHVFFGATVRYSNEAGIEREIRIVGADEIDLDRGYFTWMSPLANALMKAGPGDTVILRAPGGTEELEILEVRYEQIPIEPFSPPPGAQAAGKGNPVNCQLNCWRVLVRHTLRAAPPQASVRPDPCAKRESARTQGHGSRFASVEIEPPARNLTIRPRLK